MKVLTLIISLFLLQSCSTSINQEKMEITEKLRSQLASTSEIELYRTPKEIRIYQCISNQEKVTKIIESIDLSHEVLFSKVPFNCHFIFKSDKETMEISIDGNNLRFQGRQYQLTEQSSQSLGRYFRTLLTAN